MSLVRLFQWLSAAFVTFTVISWIAVGTPATTTRFLWFVQDLIAIASEKISETDFELRPEMEQQRQQEEEFHDGYEGYYQEKKRKLGSKVTGELRTEPRPSKEKRRLVQLE